MMSWPWRQGPVAAAGEPPQCTSVTVSTATDTAATLVLGLQWHTILGRDLARQARRRARTEAAVAWVHAGGRAESVGLLPRRLSRGVAVPRVAYAAAQAFARHAGSGVHAACLRLPEDRPGWWSALVRDGQVLMGGDWLVSDLAELVPMWAQWRARYGQNWTAWGVAPEPGSAATSAPRALAWHNLAAAVGPDSLLQHRAWRRAATWGGAWVGLVLVLGGAGWWLSGAAPSAPAGEAEAQAHAEREQQVADWLAAWQAWEQDTPVLTAGGVKQLAVMLLQVPVSVAGWGLQGLSCDWSGDRGWGCQADFRREHALGRQAGLRQALPAAWQVQWLGLEHAKAQWSVVLESAPLLRQQLPQVNHTWVADADAWLAVMPLWQRLEWGRAEPVRLAVPVPQASPDFDTSREPGVRRRSLVVSGPLRSLAVLPTTTLPQTHWQRLSLQLHPGLVAGARGAASSSLILTLQGYVYERSS